MTAEARDWLPAGALIDTVVREDCADVVSEWSARWSVQPGFVVGDLVPHTRAQAAAEPERRIGQRVEIGLSADSALDLALWSVGAQPVGTQLSSHDISVLEAMGEEIVLDLAAMLAKRLGVPALTGSASHAPFAGEVVLDLETPAQNVRLRVFLDLGALARHRKSRCVAAVCTRPALTFPATTLADTAIEIEASLGTAQLPLREFRSAEVGDVITLDTRLDAPIRLSTRSARRPIMGGRVKLSESRAILILCEKEAVFPT